MTLDNGLFWAVSLACSDSGFLKKWRQQLKWEGLPDGPLQFILAAALLHWDEFSRLLDRPSLLSYLKVHGNEDVQQEILEIYQDIKITYTITEDSKPVAWKQAEEWIQDYAIGMTLDSARAALVSGDRETAFSALLGLHEVTGREEKPPIQIDDGNLASLLSQRPDPSMACPTGLLEIDKLWNGGVYPGNLAIIMAPTNIGKSMTLCFFASEAYKANKKVLYFTYELSKLQILERVLSALFKTGPKNFGEDADAQLLALREGLGLTRAAFSIDDGISSVADLKRRIEEEDIDLVLLDSADDMKPVQPNSQLWQAQGEIYTDLLLDICQGLNVPIWTSVQANRESVEKARLSLKNIGDSFKKAQRAHLVLALAQTPDELANPTGPLVRVMVLKDTMHGSRGRQWFRYGTKFGQGEDGYPGFVLHDIRGDV